jgi:eukaryotic-like serine/threonine-protein kinase
MNVEMLDEPKKANPTLGQYVEAYEQAIAAGRFVSIREFLPPDSDEAYNEVLEEILRVKIELDWAKGEQQTLDRILKEFPEVRANPGLLNSLAFEDYRQRASGTCEQSPESYAERYGVDVSRWTENLSYADDYGMNHEFGARESWRAAKDDTQPNSSIAETSDGPNEYPTAGTILGEFQIEFEIGEGAFSRVFVARQMDLADRLVAVKVTSMPLGESQRLAKLQHANIMPLYSGHRHRKWFLLCMPYLGNKTLKHLIDDLKGTAWKALRDNVGRYFSDIFKPTDARIANEFAKSNFVENILRIGQKIASGLAHAHERGVFHQDIKPANVLISFEGEPLLLDFNLSREQDKLGNLSGPAIGGTLPYMSAEQLQSLIVKDSVSPPTATADIFALGVLLYQLLSGRLPHEDSESKVLSPEELLAARSRAIVPLTTLNRSLPPAVNAIVMKCLEHKPEARYQSAADLAEDLQLQLEARPLRHAANPSWSELARKFWRRHPRLISVSNASLFFIAIIGVLSWGMWTVYQRSQSITAIEEYQSFIRKAHQAEAELLFPDGGSHSSGLRRTIAALQSFEMDRDPDWRKRSRFKFLSEEKKADLNLHVSHLKRLAQGAAVDDTAELSAAGLGLENLSELENLNAEGPIPADPLAQAFELYEQRQYQASIEILERELKRWPSRFALWFLLGKCHYELREYRQAEHGFAMAGLIDRESAMSHLGRAICFYWMNQDEAAWENLSRAGEIDPGIPAVYVNKSLLRERQGNFREALIEIERALNLQPDSARYLMVRSRLRRKNGDSAGADRDLAKVKSVQPTDPEGWIMRGVAVLSESPEAAIEDFRQASRWPGMAAVAQQNMAHVLSERLGQTDQAIVVLTELLDREPNFLPALTGRAVLYARSGEVEKARLDIEKCKSLPMSPQVHYQIGCAYSLMTVNDRKFADDAIHHLAVALKPEYGGSVMGTDRDLLPLGEDPVFQQMKSGVEAIMTRADAGVSKDSK